MGCSVRSFEEGTLPERSELEVGSVSDFSGSFSPGFKKIYLLCSSRLRAIRSLERPQGGTREVEHNPTLLLVTRRGIANSRVEK